MTLNKQDDNSESNDIPDLELIDLEDEDEDFKVEDIDDDNNNADNTDTDPFDDLSKEELSALIENTGSVCTILYK
ncbi:hypothetical protein H0H87_005040, partial [Tephrocybe sp. NHM501043]